MIYVVATLIAVLFVAFVLTKVHKAGYKKGIKNSIIKNYGK